MAEKILVLGINGSPNKKGKTTKLLKKVLEAIEKYGAKTTLINLYEKNIRPCLGCYSLGAKKCRYPCIIKDGMWDLYKILEKIDILVLATPTYWFNMSGMMKNFIDRLCCMENNGFLLQGKMAILVASEEDEGAMMALSSMAMALNHMGFIVMPYCIYAPSFESGVNWVPETIKFISKKAIEMAHAFRKINWQEK